MIITKYVILFYIEILIGKYTFNINYIQYYVIY